MMWFILGNWFLSKLKFEPNVHVFGERKNTKRRHVSRLVPQDSEEKETSSEENSDDNEEEDNEL
jgi:hypothetical protein